MTPVEIARRFYELFNERRLDEAERLVHPHAMFHYLPTRQRLIGRAGYRALVGAWLQAFSDARLEIVSASATTDGVSLTFIGRGTLTGELVLGEQLMLPPTGRSAELTFQDRLTIKDGLIVESQLDFDVDEMRRRLLDG